MNEKITKMLPVSEEVHYQFSLEAKKNRMTYNEFINYLLALHRQEQVKNFKK
jgi:hypothetical protein